MESIKGNRVLVIMVIWLVILGSFAYWFELETWRKEKQLALAVARSFFQQIENSLQWNSLHDGVYVPASPETPSNPYLPEHSRELTTDTGLKLTRINPAYMIRQLAKLAQENGDEIRFHITSLKPIRPENKAADWEEKFLRSLEQGGKEQGDFYEDGKFTWFRYMAPLSMGSQCLKCHEQPGGNEEENRSGISVSIPYITHTHLELVVGYGSVVIIGLIFIFIGDKLYARKQRLLDATFNSPIPICVTDKDYTILTANESYWSEFGPLPAGHKSIKCYEHRPGLSCHTDNCPLTQILSGSSKYICEPSKEKEGACQHFIVTATPLLDAKGRVVGIVESFQDITKRKQLEREKEQLIDELKKSLSEVKVLSGLIPICASCKKVRDDQGYWSQVESYISKHSKAQFSHGICPDCVRELYPEYSDEILPRGDS